MFDRGVDDWGVGAWIGSGSVPRGVCSDCAMDWMVVGSDGSHRGMVLCVATPHAAIAVATSAATVATNSALIASSQGTRRRLPRAWWRG